ncbi:uncharacterized protein SPAPADRAFT_62673 [Spathaspora passalidarum NRRL Y-27907]|uniref:pH-response transcription factor pacC/RIM101 n=1 Tax=Spathaspora passalidarum (strain NRRL Y-27907 / 11-Y1) TaxID=619300 RepID=G3AT45_SPAPN|nr:uncharacterized protein SPAPADRAFT_62673 [Spathaspora passalidarum NRRL Y-27907]EGW30808.1 hypothetical protein SPAPADRAFT_62673 [Spathaspora passalidarum NRRL Y-27907]
MAEDSGTPLLTPTASSKRSTRIRPSSSGTFFSPLSSNTSTTIQSSTLDRIEIPEDDALKQLRKARSFSSLSKRKSQQQYPQQQSQSEPQHSMIFGEDLSIRLEQDLNPSETLESTSSSTPGVFYNDMPGSSINYEASLRSLSVPSSATSSTAASGIDLLSPQFDNSRPSPYPQVNKSFSRSLTGSNSFIKSYPASIDLATIANSHYQVTNGGLLPPMATFTVQHNDEDSDEEQQLPRHSESDEDDTTVTLPIPQDLQITIPVVRNNRSEKNDKVDPKKKHKCPICESRFQRPEHVKRHMKSHSSEKPFQCEEPDCGKRFNRKDNLKAHLKKIHGKQV